MKQGRKRGMEGERERGGITILYISTGLKAYIYMTYEEQHIQTLTCDT
jgi:hypothetical protein